MQAFTLYYEHEDKGRKQWIFFGWTRADTVPAARREALAKLEALHAYGATGRVKVRRF